jgi:2-aminobenzoate-CoA ligase
MRPLPPNTIGALAVRGPTGCRYLDDVERQRHVVRGGWTLTGDAFAMDEDGYFTYHARLDDLIVSAGYNISGAEVEDVLLRHPAVKECAVVGLPDPARGQVVAAFVVLREQAGGADGLARVLQDFAKAAIAPYKYPRRIEFVSALPRTDSGKVQRHALRRLPTGTDK